MRAALLLVDVLGWKPQEAAASLETSVFPVNSLLQRARDGVAARSEHAAPDEVSNSDRALLQRFISAWENGDQQAFTALLTKDALFTMPPQPEWYEGRAAIGQFFAAVWSARPGQRRLLPLAANGGPAVAVYRRSLSANAVFEPAGITLITNSGGPHLANHPLW